MLAGPCSRNHADRQQSRRKTCPKIPGYLQFNEDEVPAVDGIKRVPIPSDARRDPHWDDEWDD